MAWTVPDRRGGKQVDGDGGIRGRLGDGHLASIEAQDRRNRVAVVRIGSKPYLVAVGDAVAIEVRPFEYVVNGLDGVIGVGVDDGKLLPVGHAVPVSVGVGKCDLDPCYAARDDERIVGVESGGFP
jgi:hypothetical protein